MDEEKAQELTEFLKKHDYRFGIFTCINQDSKSEVFMLGDQELQPYVPDILDGLLVSLEYLKTREDSSSTPPEIMKFEKEFYPKYFPLNSLGKG